MLLNSPFDALLDHDAAKANLPPQGKSLMPLLDPDMSPTCAKRETGETAIAE